MKAREKILAIISTVGHAHITEEEMDAHVDYHGQVSLSVAVEERQQEARPGTGVETRSSNPER